MDFKTTKDARQLIKALNESCENTNIDLSAIEVRTGKWEIYYGSKKMGCEMPTNAVPYALHTLWMFVKDIDLYKAI